MKKILSLLCLFALFSILAPQARAADDGWKQQIESCSNSVFLLCSPLDTDPQGTQLMELLDNLKSVAPAINVQYMGLGEMSKARCVEIESRMSRQYTVPRLLEALLPYEQGPFSLHCNNIRASGGFSGSN